MNLSYMNLGIAERYLPILVDFSARMFGALILAVITIWFAGKIRSLILLSTRRARIDPTVGKFASDVGRWFVIVMAGVALLGIFGIQTTSFAALIAASGLAIGLAFQGALSNLAAGVMLLIFRPYKVGQFINVTGVSGTVNEIELFTTTIDTSDMRRIIIPNSKIFGSTIENVSFHSKRRLDISVTVDYSASVEATKEILIAAVHAVDDILETPVPRALLTEVTTSNVVWTVRVWVKSERIDQVRESLLQSIKFMIDEAKISVPSAKQN